MDSDNLVRMANRIGDFFEAMPDRDEALEGIATHLKKFWDPRMRRQFLEMVDANAGANAPGLKDIVRVAVERHRALLA
ncbi:formate dehydrogenase subunit delta [Caenimonas koreensis]|uniref:formate dehydrogenase subunit delta n=1 Tax=Caenimonas koreensis TaxID=367474 RepID=UPI0037838C1E